MKKSNLVLAGLLGGLGVIASSMTAQALDFNWELSTAQGNFGGTITGLQDNSINPFSQFSVALTNYSGGSLPVPLGSYNFAPGFTPASIKVLSGKIVDIVGGDGGYWYGYFKDNFVSYSALTFNGSDGGFGGYGFGTASYQYDTENGGFGVTPGSITYTAATAVPFDFNPTEGAALGIPLFIGLGMLRKKKLAQKSAAKKVAELVA